MHEESLDPALSRRLAAIAQLDRHFAEIPEAGPLSSHALERYQRHDRGFRSGWHVSVDFSDGIRRSLHILADDDFPYTPPRIVVVNGPPVLTWPHLENDGFLCVIPPDAAVSVEDPIGVAKFIVGDACRMIEENISERNLSDFHDEFLSYWALSADKQATPFTSVLDPGGPGRRMRVCRGQRMRVVGETSDALKAWLSHRGIRGSNGRDLSFDDAVLIWLSEPLAPTEYPQTAAEVRALAREQSPEAASVLEELASSGPCEINIIIGTRTRNGVCFAAMTIQSPLESAGPKRMSNPLTKGFRPNHVPPQLLVNRYFSESAKPKRATVGRADHAWIHGRDRSIRQERLRKVQVGILGCGSVGGGLAKLLAQAGVGNLLLVDQGCLDWPNIGRHQLGAKSVGNPKAVALAKEFEEAFPHLNTFWRRERVGPNARSLMAELASYDLIISTMGNWVAECFLNDWQQANRNTPSILYGWVEPRAAAAHAVLIISGGPCFRCGTNDKGRPVLEATEWAEDATTFQEPACGAMFTPYGSIELCWAHALLSEAAMDALTDRETRARHRTWLSSLDRVAAAGGKWSERWVSEMGDPGVGRITTERSWPASDSCPVCRGQAYKA